MNGLIVNLLTTDLWSASRVAEDSSYHVNMLNLSNAEARFFQGIRMQRFSKIN